MNSAQRQVSGPPAAQPQASGPAPVVRPPEPPVPACQNCGAPVAGRYCSNCGQRAEAPVHSLWHFAQIAAEDLTHADSRLWRTLAALLFKPGFLTREFLAGRRAGYLPPFRLYLVLSVVFFLWAANTHRGMQVLQISDSDHGPTKVQMAPLAGGKDSPLGPALPGESAEQRGERLCANFHYGGPWKAQLAPKAQALCVKVASDNGASLREAYLHNIPRAMFLFLPLLAMIMMLMYWRPRHYYVEHLLLFLHNHAFLFLLFVLTGILSAVLPFLSGALSFAATLYVAWYAYRSVRVVYGQGRWLTLGKLTVLAFFYLVSFSLMTALTMVYSLLTL